MADITMCANQECPSKDKCYRFTAHPNQYWQSWAEFKPEEGEIACGEFIERGKNENN